MPHHRVTWSGASERAPARPGARCTRAASARGVRTAPTRPCARCTRAASARGAAGRGLEVVVRRSRGSATRLSDATRRGRRGYFARRPGSALGCRTTRARGGPPRTSTRDKGALLFGFRPRGQVCQLKIPKSRSRNPGEQCTHADAPRRDRGPGRQPADGEIDESSPTRLLDQRSRSSRRTVCGTRAKSLGSIE